MVLQGDSDINLNRRRSKKKKTVENGNWRPWSELPEALLFLITKQLGTIDYLLFGRVCRTWRLYAVAYRQVFMASQHPLVFFMSKGTGRIILVSLAKPVPEFAIICSSQWCLQFCRSTDVSWTLCRYDHPIVDITVFKGKIYVISMYGEIGMLHLNSHPSVTMLKVQRIANLNPSLKLQLLGSDEQLRLICRIDDNYEVYVLNFLKMECVQMQNFGGQTLFQDHILGSGFSNITVAKDKEQPSNCIYRFRHDGKVIFHRFLDDRDPQFFPIMHGNRMPDAFPIKPTWFFPHLSCNVDSLSED
uniref:F-box protein n=1 Tax=Quercus lobata TaxID=97700 RepID=A0A7N2QZU5_QUELO